MKYLVLLLCLISYPAFATNGNGNPGGVSSGGSPGGSSGQVQYNSSGSFGANSSFTTDGSGNITLAGGVTMSGQYITANNGNGLAIIAGGGNRFSVSQAQVVVDPYWSSNATFPVFQVNPVGGSTLTASTNAPITQFTSPVRQHSTGTLALQTDYEFLGALDSFAAASTQTLGATLEATQKDCSTNGTCTSETAIYVPTYAYTGTVTNGYGAYIVAPTGATNNYAAYFGGTVGIGTSSAYVGTTALNINGGTQTTNVPAVYIAQTWNNAATTFDAPIFENITNTASNAASKLMDLQVGGTSKLAVDENGFISIGAVSNVISTLGNFALLLPSSFYMGGTLIGSDNPSGSSLLKLSDGAGNTIFFGALHQTGYNNILYLGDGLNTTTPSAQGISGSGVYSGYTNIAGGDLELLGGIGTGTGAGGSIVFQTAPAGTTGTAQNAVVTVMKVNSTGSLILNNASSHAGQATCWTTSGQIGYCTTIVGAGGGCTCTGL